MFSIQCALIVFPSEECAFLRQNISLIPLYKRYYCTPPIKSPTDMYIIGAYVHYLYLFWWDTYCCISGDK